MPKYVVGTVDQIPPGDRKLVEIRGRPITIFNLDGDFFGILDRCPHQGASLCKGQIVGLVESDEPGTYNFSRKYDIIRCPWHGWEFDIADGQAVADRKWSLRKFDVEVRGEDVYVLA